MAYQMPDQKWLYDLFRRVDRDGSGAINAVELQSALSNGTWSAFNGETVRLMIGMFDKDRSGSINYQEFIALWDYVTRWLNCFKSFDRDGSGNIDRNELKQALTTFGYRLSDNFYTIIIRKFDRKGAGSIYFDDFIQLCVLLQSLTSAFRLHDTDQDGWIQIDYERFLTMVFDVCIV